MNPRWSSREPYEAPLAMAAGIPGDGSVMREAIRGCIRWAKCCLLVVVARLVAPSYSTHSAQQFNKASQ